MDEYLTKEEVEESFPTFRSHFRDWLKENYYRMAPEDRYHRTIEIYVDDGYFFPHSYIIGLKRIKPDNYLDGLPEQYKDIDPITVYRASAMPASRLEYEISWTIEKDVAIWFYQRLHPAVRRLYKATISKGNIIAYTNERGEYEVLQHRGVKNIQAIPVSDTEVERAVKKHNEALEAALHPEEKY